MSLRKPNKRDLQTGKVVEVYDRGGTLKGKAKLIQRKPSRYFQDGLGYIKLERTNKDQEPTLYIWAGERWLIEWVEHNYYREGDKTCTEIHHYICTTTDYPSFVDSSCTGNKGLAATEGLYVFLEEGGVLTVNGTDYTPEALKALKRVKRACDGEVVVFSHNPLQVKEHWELNKVPYRIFDFLSADMTFGEAVQDYLDKNEVEDYIILSGDSYVRGDRVIQTSPEIGLKLKYKNT